MADNEIIRLEQCIPTDGYKWVHGVSATLDTRFLAPVDDSGFVSFKTYNPVENKALFRKFVATDPTPEGILELANQCGSLRKAELVKTDSGEDIWCFDAIEIWKEEIEAMRPVVALWDALQEKSIHALQDYLKWEDERTLTAPNAVLHLGATRLTRERRTIICVDVGPDPQSKNAKLVAAALSYIEYMINKHLEECSGIRIARLDGQLRLVIRADCLRDVLWLQCAQAISQRKEFRLCKQCNSWFEPYSEKTKKAFCSTGCRLKYYRSRIAEAQRLHEQGKPPSEISKTLGADIKTVRGWIKKGQK